MLNGPVQAIKRRLLIYLLQGIQEGSDVLIVTEVYPERHPPLDELRDIFLYFRAHQLRIDDDRRPIKIFVIVQREPESLPVTFIFMTMRHPRIQVLAGTDWGLLGYGGLFSYGRFY